MNTITNGCTYINLLGNFAYQTTDFTDELLIRTTQQINLTVRIFTILPAKHLQYKRLY